MSLEEVARATRVPIASMERIEAGQFDELPGEVDVGVEGGSEQQGYGDRWSGQGAQDVEGDADLAVHLERAHGVHTAGADR